MKLREISGRLRRGWPRSTDARIREWTGIAPDEWGELARAFPLLGERPGPRAARARRDLHDLCARALSTGRWRPRLDGTAPGPEPTVYLTAHFGSLGALRYCLRSHGVPVANALGPHNLRRPEMEARDRIFDARFPMRFPHVFEASRVHRLRTALRSGSLLLAADLPGGQSVEVDWLGGRVRLDPRPIRLARAAGVSCRPAFLTLPRQGWTLTLGAELPPGEASALRAFGAVYAAVAAEAPWDVDGVVYRRLAVPTP